MTHSITANTLIRSALLGATLSLSGLAAAPVALAQTAVTEAANPSGDFIKKRKKLKGSYEIIQRDGKTLISFSDDFRAANGPDLKVFLSPQSIDSVSGKTAVNGSINLGELKSTRGVQTYEVPDGVDLAAFGSVLVHCEEYSVLWGGADL